MRDLRAFIIFFQGTFFWLEFTIDHGKGSSGCQKSDKPLIARGQMVRWHSVD